jgi:hypothetical protein
VRRLRRLGGAFAAALVAWITLLALVGLFGDGCVRDRAQERLANSMRATVVIGGADVGLVTGSLALRDVRIERVEQGVMRLTIDRVDVDLRPLGLALVQDDLGRVEVEGVDVELSALAALDNRGAREPVTFESLDLRDAHVAIEATSLLPGLARIELTIERAVAGETTMRTPLSWLFALRELTARLDLPGGITVRCSYANGVLQLAGGLFGDTPLVLPFVIPVLDPAREVEQLGEIGRDLGRRLVEQVGVRWLRRQL